jgi:hypothetical protein
MLQPDDHAFNKAKAALQIQATAVSQPNHRRLQRPPFAIWLDYMIFELSSVSYKIVFII